MYLTGTLTWTSLIQYEQKRPVECQKVCVILVTIIIVRVFWTKTNTNMKLWFWKWWRCTLRFFWWRIPGETPKEKQAHANQCLGSCWLRWGLQAMKPRRGMCNQYKRRRCCNRPPISGDCNPTCPPPDSTQSQMNFTAADMNRWWRRFGSSWFFRFEQLSPPSPSTFSSLPLKPLLWPSGLIVATLCLFVPFLCRHTKPTSRRPVLSSQLTLAREPFSPQDAQHGVKNETHGEKGPHICTTNLQK